MNVPKEVEAALHKAAQRFISDDEFAKFFNDAKKHAIETEETDGEISMMMVAHFRLRSDADDQTKDTWLEVPIVFADWPPPDNKKFEAMRGLGIKLAADFPDYMLVSVIHMSEAWMAMYHEEDGNGDKAYLKDGVPLPSERPDRMEVLIIDGMTIDQRHSTLTIPIIRKESGDFGTWGSPLENLYNPSETDDSKSQTNFLLLSLFQGSTGATGRSMEDKAK